MRFVVVVHAAAERLGGGRSRNRLRSADADHDCDNDKKGREAKIDSDTDTEEEKSGSRQSMTRTPQRSPAERVDLGSCSGLTARQPDSALAQ